MVTVSKSTIVENIHQNFYDLFNAITGFAGKVYPAFPQLSLQAAESKSSYPIFILESPDIEDQSNFTLNKLKVTGTITLEIYTTNAKDADYFASDSFDKIESSIRTLRGQGLKFIKLDSMNKDVVQRGKINVHLKSVTFAYEFVFDRTSLSW